MCRNTGQTGRFNLPQETKWGNFKKPDIALFTQQVKNAQDAVSPNVANKSFKKCCISNELNGTKDNAIFYEIVSDGLGTVTDTDISVHR